MKNKVKYAPFRKYRDVGFNEIPKKEERVRPKTSFKLKQKKSLFKKITEWFKGK